MEATKGVSPKRAVVFVIAVAAAVAIIGFSAYHFMRLASVDERAPTTSVLAPAQQPVPPIKSEPAPAQQPGPAPSPTITGAAPRFSITEATAVRGEEYRIIRQVSPEHCSNQCAEDNRCKMFAYWNNQICYLFDQDFDTYPTGASMVGVHKSR
jgi:hypothetical protein